MMFLDPIIGRFSDDLAIDLGTANTPCLCKRKGCRGQRTLYGSSK